MLHYLHHFLPEIITLITTAASHFHPYAVELFVKFGSPWRLHVVSSLGASMIIVSGMGARWCLHRHLDSACHGLYTRILCHLQKVEQLIAIDSDVKQRCDKSNHKNGECG